MLVPKTYGVRKTRSVDMNYGHRFDVESTNPSEESFNDAKSTKKNVNKDKNSITNETIAVYKNHSNEIIRKFDDLSLSQKKPVNNCFRFIGEQKPNSAVEKKCVFEKNDYEQTSGKKYFRGVTKTEIADETKKRNTVQVIMPADSRYDSKGINDSLNLAIKNVKTNVADTVVQIEDEFNHNEIFNDGYDERAQNINYVNKSSPPLQSGYEVVGEVEIFKKCKKCDNVCSLSFNDWNQLSESNKNKLLQKVSLTHISLTQATNNSETTSELLSTSITIYT